MSGLDGCIGERGERVWWLVPPAAGPNRRAAGSIHSMALNAAVAVIPLVAACLVTGSTGNMEETSLWREVRQDCVRN